MKVCYLVQNVLPDRQCLVFSRVLFYALSILEEIDSWITIDALLITQLFRILAVDFGHVKFILVGEIFLGDSFLDL